MNDQQLVLVTGASGFIAGHIVLQLLDRGYRVRGSLRSMDRAESMRNVVESNGGDVSRLEFCQADLTSDAGWKEAVADCSAVMHVASPIATTLPKDPNDLIVPARDGVRRVLDAAIAEGVPRVVMTSSNAAVSYGHQNAPERPLDETHWSEPGGPGMTPYVTSKTLAEQDAWEIVKKANGKTTLTTILPGLVLGPVLEEDFGTSAAVVRKLMLGEFPGCPDFGWPTVDVRDVAALHILALESDQAADERFLCANGYASLRQIAEVVRDWFPEYRGKVKTRPLPNWLVRVFAVFDKETRSVVSELGRRKPVNATKARDVLDWRPRSVEEAVVGTGESLIKHGLV